MGYGVHTTAKGSPEVFIVTEYIDGGDLHLLLKTLSIELPWPLRIAMTTDIARAMCFLHALNWVHRDLKTENLLVCLLLSQRIFLLPFPPSSHIYISG